MTKVEARLGIRHRHRNMKAHEFSRAAGAAILSAAATISIGAAHAQEPASAPAPQQNVRTMVAEEVVVTARRREESAQDVPIAITAIDAEQIENLRIDNMESLQTLAPALSVSAASGRPNAPVYSLRGIRPTEAIYGQDPTVAVYFADFVLSPAEGSNLGLYDLASVQVLKGPQGTLFGRNTTGGAILFVPQRPGDVFGGNVMVGFGNYGRTETQIGLDIPAADNFAMRIAGRMVESDGYQTNVIAGPLHGRKMAGEDTRNLRLSAVWDITDTIENYTVLSWDSKDGNGRAAVLQAVNPTSTMRLFPAMFEALARAQGRDVHDVETDMPQYDEIEAWSLVNTTTLELSDELTLKSIAGYRDLQTHSTYDIDASPIPGVLTAGSNVPGVLTAPEQTVTLQHYSYELQLLGDEALDGRLNWVTGLYWYHEQGYQFSPGDVLLPINPNNPFAQRGYADNDSYSVFAQGTYSFSPQWSLTAGARWNHDEREMTLTTQTPSTCSLRDPATNVALPLSQCAITLSDEFSDPTGTLSLEFKPTDDVLLYAASRLGYRSGGFNLRATQQIEYEPFDPESVIDVELGAKTEWYVGDWRMRSNIAAYQQWYDDIQRTVAVQNFLGVPGSAVQNAAKAKVFGVELEQLIAPTESLSLQINYSYTDPEYDEWTETVGGVERDLSRTPFHFTPKHAGSALLSYVIPLGGAAGELRFTGNASYKSGVWINSLQNILAIEATPIAVRPALRQEEYWLYDVGAGWEDVMGSGVDVSAYVRNLTDEEYTLGGVQLYTTFGMSTKAFAEPRTYGMELRYRF